MRFDLSLINQFFKVTVHLPAVQVATALPIVMKLAGPVSKAVGRFSKDRRARHLRQEITALQQFRSSVPSDLQEVLDAQLGKLHQRYKKMFAAKEIPYAVYPNIPWWRKPLLLYLPARNRALIPQFMFYALIIFAFYFLVRSFSWTNFIVISAFIWILRDWAKRSEQPRNERALFDRIFLTYPSPPGASNNFYRLMMILAAVIFIAVTFASSPWEIAGGLLGIVGLFAAFNDFERSFDVLKPAKNVPSDKSHSQNA